MELGQFEDYVRSFKQGSKFSYGVSKPFSWRGSYNEVAFEILQKTMTREEILENISKALTQTFYGYKGGEYTYNEYTDIHFESDISSWTDGRYCANKIAEIEDLEPYQSQEERLVKLMFIK